MAESKRLVGIREKFKRFFNTEDIFCDPIGMELGLDYVIDARRFEKWLEKEHGYDIHLYGSSGVFIRKKFGEDAETFIDSLLFAHMK